MIRTTILNSEDNDLNTIDKAIEWIMDMYLREFRMLDEVMIELVRSREKRGWSAIISGSIKEIK